MCNFKPGEVLGFGQLSEMMELTRDWSIPGEINPVPLLPEGTPTELGPTSYEGMGFLHVTDVPEGLELLTLSKLSAALATPIGRHRAIVEPNYILPFGGPAPNPSAAFSPAMQTVVDELRNLISSRPDVYRIAVLDSGISAADLKNVQSLRCFDYMGTRPAQVNHSSVTDRQNHGALVCRIVADVMDGRAEMMFGRIAIGRSDVTVLSLSQAHAHMVATTRPHVINLSVAPRKDTFVCPQCHAILDPGSFYSMILPRVFQLAGHTTWTVLAAGNTGRPCVGQHAFAECDQMVIASAWGANKTRPAYSGYATNPGIAEIHGFGGDDQKTPGAQGVLDSGAYVFGTSFAAPLVSCALASAIYDNRGNQGAANGAYERGVIARGVSQMRQAHAAL